MELSSNQVPSSCNIPLRARAAENSGRCEPAVFVGEHVCSCHSMLEIIWRLLTRTALEERSDTWLSEVVLHSMSQVCSLQIKAVGQRWEGREEFPHFGTGTETRLKTFSYLSIGVQQCSLFVKWKGYECATNILYVVV